MIVSCRFFRSARPVALLISVYLEATFDVMDRIRLDACTKCTPLVVENGGKFIGHGPSVTKLSTNLKNTSKKAAGIRIHA